MTENDRIVSSCKVYWLKCSYACGNGLNDVVTKGRNNFGAKIQRKKNSVQPNVNKRLRIFVKLLYEFLSKKSVKLNW